MKEKVNKKDTSYVVPSGSAVQSTMSKEHSQMIIYNVNQARMKYLVRVKV